jgi:hypothetical protein
MTVAVQGKRIIIFFFLSILFLPHFMVYFTPFLAIQIHKFSLCKIFGNAKLQKIHKTGRPLRQLLTDFQQNVEKKVKNLSFCQYFDGFLAKKCLFSKTYVLIYKKKY